MARTRRIITIDEKIAEQKQIVSHAKAKYESSLEVLNDLMKKRDEQRTKEILEAITSSEHTYDEILDFIKSHAGKE